MRILLGGGTQHNLLRVIREAKHTLPDVTFDYATSDVSPVVWGRKGRAADVVIIRTGWVSHKAWKKAKANCTDVVSVPINGEEAMLDAINAAYRKHSTWTSMISWKTSDTDWCPLSASSSSQLF